MAKELIYPERQRCRVCRSYFGFIVVDGRYCSYGCAELPEPSRDPVDWPREHYVPLRGRVRQEKRVYMSQAEAQQGALSQNNGKHPYQCRYCRMWHIGDSSLPARQWWPRGRTRRAGRPHPFTRGTAMTKENDFKSEMRRRAAAVLSTKIGEQVPAESVQLTLHAAGSQEDETGVAAWITVEGRAVSGRHVQVYFEDADGVDQFLAALGKVHDHD